MAKIAAIGHANPERRLTQEESWHHLNQLRKLSPLEKKYYKRFMLDEGIKARYLALKKLEDIFSEDQDAIIQRYLEAAPALSAESAANALNKAKLDKEKIDHLSTATCTGYLCPGLSSYMLERAGFRPETSTFDLQGMGCGAALPTLSSAEAFLAKKRTISYAMATCTEVCSAAVYWEDDLGLILSNSIFADGSASAILTNDPEAGGPEILDYTVITYPERRDALKFGIKNGKLRNTLSLAVPEIASRGVEAIVSNLLKKNRLSQKEIAFWAIHTGGRKVLSVIADKLSLAPADTQFSEEVLRDFGNMSSPSVLFVLEKIIESNLPKNGDYGMLLSFGAGFSCYGMLLRWQ